MSWNPLFQEHKQLHCVTPSRVCELKSALLAVFWNCWRHTLTGVWVEMHSLIYIRFHFSCHTLTGVWVEIIDSTFTFSCNPVTPSRVCELKLPNPSNVEYSSWSHPHGCVSWNFHFIWCRHITFVTPSRVCELKYRKYINEVLKENVTPSRVCELKSEQANRYQGLNRHTLTGVWVEIAKMIKERNPCRSHPHGCVSWNNVHNSIEICG